MIVLCQSHHESLWGYLQATATRHLNWNGQSWKHWQKYLTAFCVITPILNGCCGHSPWRKDIHTRIAKLLRARNRPHGIDFHANHQSIYHPRPIYQFHLGSTWSSRCLCGTWTSRHHWTRQRNVPWSRTRKNHYLEQRAQKLDSGFTMIYEYLPFIAISEGSLI